jgi:alpha-tubulin suppressor-like RCC1 family protein
MLFVFGKGSQGQLGIGDLDDQLDPVLVEGFRGSIVGAAGGENHTVICNGMVSLELFLDVICRLWRCLLLW